MASYLPPEENLPIFNPNIFPSGEDEGITLADAEKRYLKKSGGIMTGTLAVPTITLNGQDVETKLDEIDDLSTDITALQTKTQDMTFDTDTTTFANNLDVDGTLSTPNVDDHDDSIKSLETKTQDLSFDANTSTFSGNLVATDDIYTSGSNKFIGIYEDANNFVKLYDHANHADLDFKNTDNALHVKNDGTELVEFKANQVEFHQPLTANTTVDMGTSSAKFGKGYFTDINLPSVVSVNTDLPAVSAKVVDMSYASNTTTFANNVHVDGTLSTTNISSHDSAITALQTRTTKVSYLAGVPTGGTTIVTDDLNVTGSSFLEGDVTIGDDTNDAVINFDAGSSTSAKIYQSASYGLELRSSGNVQIGASTTTDNSNTNVVFRDTETGFFKDLKTTVDVNIGTSDDPFGTGYFANVFAQGTDSEITGKTMNYIDSETSTTTNIETEIKTKRDDFQLGTNLALNTATTPPTLNASGGTYTAATNGGLGLSGTAFSINLTNLNDKLVLPQKFEITSNDTSQLVIAPSTSGNDAAMALRGKRDGSTTNRQAQIRFQNDDIDAGVGVKDLCEIAGIVTDPTQNRGGLQIANFQDGSTRTSAAKMSKSGNWTFGTGDFQDTYKLQLNGSMSATGTIHPTSGMGHNATWLLGRTNSATASPSTTNSYSWVELQQSKLALKGDFMEFRTGNLGVNTRRQLITDNTTTIYNDLVVEGNPSKRICVMNMRRNDSSSGNWGQNAQGYDAYFDFAANTYRMGASIGNESNGVFTLSVTGTYKISVQVKCESQTQNDRAVMGSYISINDNTGSWKNENNSGRFGLTYLRDDNFGFGGSHSYHDYFELDSGNTIRIKTRVALGTDTNHVYTDEVSDDVIHMYGRLEVELISPSDIIEPGDGQ